MLVFWSPAIARVLSAFSLRDVLGGRVLDEVHCAGAYRRAARGVIRDRDHLDAIEVGLARVPVIRVALQRQFVFGV